MTSAASSTTARPLAAPAARVERWRRQLPNALTVFRVILAIGFFVMISLWAGPGPHAGRGAPAGPLDLTLILCASLFIVAAITDALDGYFSRRWGVTSVFGRVMDPFADKVLVIGAFTYLAGPTFQVALDTGKILHVSGVLPWMVVLILSRELLVTSIRGVVESKGRSFQATLSGKLKMIVQSSAVPTILLAIAILDVSPGSVGRHLIDIVVWVTVGVTLWSGVPYIQRGIAALSESSDPG